VEKRINGRESNGKPWRLIVGQIIKTWRCRRGLTQTEVCDKMGWCHTTLTQMERGRQSISLDQLFQLASAYGLHVLDLLPGELTGAGRGRY